LIAFGSDISGRIGPEPGSFPTVVATLNPDGSVLYAINDNGTLLKSSDGGTTWMKSATGFFGPTSIKVDPRNSNTIYVLDQRGLHKSTDGGSTFVKLAAPSNVQAFALDSSEALLCHRHNPLDVNTDSGKTFATVPNVASFEINSVSALAGKVYVGSITPPVPFVMKLDPSGSHILYSTFLGGSFGDSISGIAVDSAGNAVVVGSTFSTSFPVTAPASKAPSSTRADGFVVK
jgi:beta-propeller repeat-containing protein